MAASRANGSSGHGYTYGGHPVACAVAIETVKIYAERDIVGHVRSVAPVFLDGLAALSTHPLVGDVRGVGLIAGVELMQDRSTRAAFPPGLKVGLTVQEACQAEGLIVRAIGDRIAFTPPLIMTEAEAVELCSRFRKGLDRAYAQLATTARQAA